MTTPIPRILLGLEGKTDFVIKTNPWGGAKTEDTTPIAEAAGQQAALTAWMATCNAG